MRQMVLREKATVFEIAEGKALGRGSATFFKAKHASTNEEFLFMERTLPSDSRKPPPNF